MQDLSSTVLFSRDLTEQPVLFEEHSGVRKVILNRPSKLNTLTFEMVSQMFRKLQMYEDDHTVNLVILKGNGRSFCAGGDVVGIVRSMLTGHWSFGASYYKKLLILDHLIATYKKPLVCLVNGIVMGGGAGISMHGSFRVVTEKTVFAMPEASLGLFPDMGASHFLSKLPGYFGEYLGLTGARLDGAMMLACGLATHFVFSKDLPLLEHALSSVDPSNASEISFVINKFAQKSNTKVEELHKRLKSINKCFSRQTVEEILHSIEKELLDNLAEKWIAVAVKGMKSASPTSLKVFLRSIREGRGQRIEQCLAREYIIFCNIVRRKITNDFYETTQINTDSAIDFMGPTAGAHIINGEDDQYLCNRGSRATLFDKDKKPKWEPPKLESVGSETVDMLFKPLEDEDDWNCLQLPARSSNSVDHARSKL